MTLSKSTAPEAEQGDHFLLDLTSRSPIMTLGQMEFALNQVTRKVVSHFLHTDVQHNAAIQSSIHPYEAIALWKN